MNWRQTFWTVVCVLIRAVPRGPPALAKREWKLDSITFQWKSFARGIVRTVTERSSGVFLPSVFVDVWDLDGLLVTNVLAPREPGRTTKLNGVTQKFPILTRVATCVSTETR